MTAQGLRAFDESQSYTSPERRLMLATVASAVADALGNAAISHPGQRDKVRREAMAWFRGAGEDFQTVCHLAGLDPANTRRAALTYIASGKPLPRRSAVEHSAPSNRKPARYGASVSEIAEHADVSPSAVRNVLTGTRTASTDMNHRVRRAIRELTDLKDAA